MFFFRFPNILLYSLFGLCMIFFLMTVFFSYKCVEISKLRNPYILDSLPAHTSCLYDHLSKGDVHKELIRYFPPVTVHYIWCHKTRFEYKHYLSVLSVVKILQPDQIILHYFEMPHRERKKYFTWLEDIQRQVPMLSLKQMKDVEHCSYTFLQGVQKSQKFSNTGGIFIMDDIVLTNLTRDVFHHLMAISDENNDTSCKKGNRMSTQLFLVPEHEVQNIPLPDKVISLPCPSVTSFRESSAHFCVHFNQHFFPSDSWLENTHFHNFVRQIAYNTQIPLVPMSTNIETQRIVHVLNLNGESLDPLCFLSIKSAFILGGVDHVFLHSPNFVRNALWHELQNHGVRYVHAPELDSSLLGKLLYGLYTLVQHGGMIMTCNVIFLKHSGFLFDYPAVTTVQHNIDRLARPNQLDFTILFAKPDSLFLRTLLPVLKQFSEIDAGAVGYHVYEQYPSAVYFERNLLSHQICTRTICHSAPGEANVLQSFFTQLSWSSDTERISLEQMTSLKMVSGSVVHHILKNKAVDISFKQNKSNFNVTQVFLH